MTHTNIDTDLLPLILQDIVELIGLPLTMTLVQARGGVRLYVPKLEMEDDHYLVQLLGREAAEKLQTMYGGDEHFDLPKAERAMLAVRDATIRRLRASGTSVRSLALEYGLTERQIYFICEDMVDDRQMGMF
ncbi:MAG: Mor transcription activator family protein [Pseudomonadota bacterium]